MYNVDDESSAFGRLGSMTAVILIFAGFALIIFSIITFNSILLITCCFLPGTGLIIYGFLIFSRYIRALKYYNIYMSGSETLQDFSDILMDSKRNIRKDIAKMAQLGIMPNAHFNSDDVLVFTADNLGKNVIDVEVEESRNESNIVKQQENLSINQWKSYIKTIKEAENEFKSQDISFSLYRLSKVVEKVIDYLEKHPEKEKDVKKLMEFHLPSTVKLILSYRELDKSGINTFNIEKTKEEIVSACDKIHEAFNGVLEDLYNDKAIDVSTDIQVLKMMLSREGFLDRDVFKQNK